jgi:hypothetical protein
MYSRAIRFSSPMFSGVALSRRATEGVSVKILARPQDMAEFLKFSQTRTERQKQMDLTGTVEAESLVRDGRTLAVCHDYYLLAPLLHEPVEVARDLTNDRCPFHRSCY